VNDMQLCQLVNSEQIVVIFLIYGIPISIKPHVLTVITCYYSFYVVFKTGGLQFAGFYDSGDGLASIWKAPVWLRSGA